MNITSKDIVAWVILLLPFPIIAYFWAELPDQVPIHWGINGEPDNWADKATGIFIGPAINIGLYILMSLAPKIDPKKNFEQMKMYPTLKLMLVALFFLLFLIIMAFTLEYTTDVRWIPAAVMLLMIGIGNYMGKFRPNYFIGIRTPWTLESEEVWTKTHRLAGTLWVVASIIMLVALLLPLQPWLAINFSIYLVVIAGFPVLYSYQLHRKLGAQNA